MRVDDSADKAGDFRVAVGRIVEIVDFVDFDTMLLNF
jgi:hypothetical protein